MTSTARERLSRDQESRRRRAEELAYSRIDRRLSLAFDGEQLGTANVSPADRKKLEPILRSLAKDPHPFTKCMKNLREEQPGWSEDRRKKTCNVLKQLIGRKNGGNRQGLSLADEGACALISNEVFSLLECIDDEVLSILDTAEEHGLDMAVITAKMRKQLPPTAFVFAKGKRYPIHDLAHARNALARAAGKPEEAAVKAAVYKRFPELDPKNKKSGGKS